MDDILKSIKDLEISKSNIDELRKFHNNLKEKIDNYDNNLQVNEIKDYLNDGLEDNNINTIKFEILSYEETELDVAMCNEARILTLNIFMEGDNLPISIIWKYEYYWTDNSDYSNITINHDGLDFDEDSGIERLMTNTNDSTIQNDIKFLFKIIKEIILDV